MQIWLTAILALQLLTALVMIGLVLIQHGKGADMGASFGSGASGSLFGASGSANFLSRSTAACAALFFACTLALAFISNDGRSNAVQSSGGSVLDRAAPAASAPATAVIPGAAPTVPVPASAPTAVPVPTPMPAGIPAAIPALPASAGN
jgi:preprotein translocase subunit SecG